jgi:outer membrane lipoprotein
MKKPQEKAQESSVQIRTFINSLATLICGGLLTACASSVIVPHGVEVSAIGPAHVLEQEGLEGERVVWGGQIVEVENQAEQTVLVVASYPLDSSDRPRWQQEAGVRFIAVQAGFLEPLTFAPGRFVTLLGTVNGTEERAVGEFDYLHPRMVAEDIYLWPADPYLWGGPVHWNFGVGIHL